jgi:hypothetical protein
MWKNTRTAPKIPLQKKIAFACFSAEPPSQSKSLRRNSLLKYHQSQQEKSLDRIFGAATPPGALVFEV